MFSILHQYVPVLVIAAVVRVRHTKVTSTEEEMRTPATNRNGSEDVARSVSHADRPCDANSNSSEKINIVRDINEDNSSRK